MYRRRGRAGGRPHRRRRSSDGWGVDAAPFALATAPPAAPPVGARQPPGPNAHAPAPRPRRLLHLTGVALVIAWALGAFKSVPVEAPAPSSQKQDEPGKAAEKGAHGSHQRMRPCISQATTLSSSFADDIENYAASGCRAIEVWLTKLEQHLEHVSSADTRKTLAERGVELVAAAYQGRTASPGTRNGEPTSTTSGAARPLPDLSGSELSLSPPISHVRPIRNLSPGPWGGSPRRDAGRPASTSDWPWSFGRRLVLHQSRYGDPRSVRECHEPNVGICLDAFHFLQGAEQTRGSRSAHAGQPVPRSGL